MRACLSWQRICYILLPLLFLSTSCISPLWWGRGLDLLVETGNLVAPGDLQFPGTTTVWPAEGKSEPAMTGGTHLSKFPGPPPHYSNHPRCFASRPSPTPNNTLSCSFKAMSSQFTVWKWFFSPKYFLLIWFPQICTHMHAHAHAYTHTHTHTHTRTHH